MRLYLDCFCINYGGQALFWTLCVVIFDRIIHLIFFFQCYHLHVQGYLHFSEGRFMEATQRCMHFTFLCQSIHVRGHSNASQIYRWITHDQGISNKIGIKIKGSQTGLGILGGNIPKNYHSRFSDLHFIPSNFPIFKVWNVHWCFQLM